MTENTLIGRSATYDGRAVPQRTTRWIRFPNGTLRRQAHITWPKGNPWIRMTGRRQMAEHTVDYEPGTSIGEAERQWVA